MDELKKYLQQHAPELDLDEPRSEVWEQIRSEVQGKPKAKLVMLVTRWAVAACVLALAGIGGWYLLRQEPAREIAKVPTPIVKQPATVPVQEQPERKETVQQPSEDRLTARVETPHRQHPQAVKPRAAGEPNSNGMAALNELENSFTQVINLQRARVSNIPMYAETPEYFADFKTQMRQMEKDEKTIKTDIAKRGLSGELLDQLINLYQQKLNILKQLQIEMNKTNNRFKQNRGPVDSTRTYFLNI
ncbi:MAG: hypothetical protein JO301_16775 [Chitinophagaceae bacterium]|nr:hypothetical protein [Chitinophagaceae bacterium]